MICPCCGTILRFRARRPSVDDPVLNEMYARILRVNGYEKVGG